MAGGDLSGVQAAINVLAQTGRAPKVLGNVVRLGQVAAGALSVGQIVGGGGATASIEGVGAILVGNILHAAVMNPRVGFLFARALRTPLASPGGQMVAKQLATALQRGGYVAGRAANPQGTQ